MLKTLVGAGVGFMLILGAMLLLGYIPEWVGEGAKAYPGRAGVFLLWMGFLAAMVGFVPPPSNSGRA